MGNVQHAHCNGNVDKLECSQCVLALVLVDRLPLNISLSFSAPLAFHCIAPSVSHSNVN